MMNSFSHAEKNSFPLVSIIVPVYNAEKYLGKCVESILTQTFSNFELILVDDGSTDTSAKICDNFEKTDARITVFHKENGGQSSARNYGVNHSNGKWIAFVDADDYVTKEYLIVLLKGINQFGGNISICNYRLDGEKPVFNVENEHSPKVIERDKLKDLFLKRQINIVVTAMLIDKNTFVEQNLWFDESVKFGEDAIFYWKLILSQDYCVYNETQIYNYCVHLGSTTTAPTKEKILTNLKAFERLRQEMVHTQGSKFADFVFARQCFSIIRIYAVYKSFEEFKGVIDTVEYNKQKKALRSFPDFKVKALSFLLSVSKRMFFWVNRIRGK